jgi:hypothetical protein
MVHLIVSDDDQESSPKSRTSRRLSFNGPSTSNANQNQNSFRSRTESTQLDSFSLRQRMTNDSCGYQSELDWDQISPHSPTLKNFTTQDTNHAVRRSPRNFMTSSRSSKKSPYNTGDELFKPKPAANRRYKDQNSAFQKIADASTALQNHISHKQIPIAPSPTAVKDSVASAFGKMMTILVDKMPHNKQVKYMEKALALYGTINNELDSN